MKDIVSYLCNKLPCDIVYTNIIPYTYMCINKELNEDIISFSTTYDELRDFYFFLNHNRIYQNIYEEYLYFSLSIEERLLYDVFFFLRDKIPSQKFFHLEVILQNTNYHCTAEYFNLLKKIWLRLNKYERQQYIHSKVERIKTNVVNLWPYL